MYVYIIKTNILISRTEWRNESTNEIVFGNWRLNMLNGNYMGHI